MAFNSNTYHRNKARRQAMEYLAEARRVKALGHSPTHHATMARCQWRMYLSYVRIVQIDADHRSMSATDFVEKYR